MKGNPFKRSGGGKKSRANISKIENPKSLEEFQLQYLSRELSVNAKNAIAWRCSGLLADGIVLIDKKYYIVELKSSMYWGSLTSAIVQLVSGQNLINKHLNALSKVDKDNLGLNDDALGALPMLIAFSEFKDWEDCNNGWGQLSKHLDEFPNSKNIGVIQTNFVSGISFPP